MRKLVWICLGFAAACFAGAYFVSGLWLLILGILCLCAAVPLLCLRRIGCKRIGLILLGLTISFTWFWGYDLLYLSTARQYDGTYYETQVEITDYSQMGTSGCSADGLVYLENKPYRVRLFLFSEETLSPGDRVTGEFHVYLTTRDSIRGAGYHQGEGIYLQFSTDAAEIRRCEEIPAKYFAVAWREKILTKIQEIFPEDTFGFAKALLLGDSSSLDYAQDADLQVSGIRHVIAVSGLHVSILFAVVCLMTGRHRYLTALVGLPLLALFAALAGFTPSVLRACIMQGLLIIGILIDREYDPSSALAAAVIMILACNPMTITSVSFQLSVTCVVGIFLFSHRIHGFLLRGKRLALAKGKSLRARIVRWCANSISITLSATVAVAPLCAWHFGTVNLLGIVTNLLTMWVISFVFYGVMFACVAGALWLPLGKIIAWVISWPIRYVLLVADLIAEIPLATVYTCSIYIVIWLVLCYGLFFVFLLSKKRRPILFGSCVTICLSIAILLTWLEPRLDPYRVTVFDVGEGQCVLIQCDGKNYLIDCGGEKNTVLADEISHRLLSQGIGKLDGAALTHYDRDHAGAMANVLRRIGVDTLYLPDITASDPIRLELEETLGDKIQWVHTETAIRQEQFSIRFFGVEEDSGDNESCMCVLFQTETCDILITGDRGFAGERQLLSQTDLPELELLVAGHHVSSSSTGSELLLQTQPKNVVISAGRDNFYNHPSKQLLDRLSRFSCRVWRTDLHGTILFRG